MKTSTSECSDDIVVSARTAACGSEANDRTSSGVDCARKTAAKAMRNRPMHSIVTMRPVDPPPVAPTAASRCWSMPEAWSASVSSSPPTKTPPTNTSGTDRRPVTVSR